jgi:diaminohydroxyphosphoribosylaminopyrimidine deaminase/5-amino-6-(5-phosphoribosylamino)uracil reductase
MFDEIYMSLALEEAKKFVGATAPNPPVGACIVKNGSVLALGAHQRYGEPHAETNAISNALTKVATLNGSTLYVTLEPCNHQGKTPPCTELIIKSGISEVVFGVSDPNPKVSGGGAERLKEAGVKVRTGVLTDECATLLAPFRKFSTTGEPWIVHKLAFRELEDQSFSMIPAKGAETTFTSAESLKLAHQERKHADAIITTRATILADKPQFTVRNVQDHPGKKRTIIVISHSPHPLPQLWLERAKTNLFDTIIVEDLSQAIKYLSELRILQALIEAGPTFSKYIYEQNQWDERIIVLKKNNQSDVVVRERRIT